MNFEKRLAQGPTHPSLAGIYEEVYEYERPEIRREFARKHPVNFAQVYFPFLTTRYLFDYGEWGYHRLLLSLVHGAVQLGNWVVHAAPRGYGKSTNLGLVYPLYNICFPDTLRIPEILYFSSTHFFAKKRVKKIKDQMESNELLINDFGSFVGRIWSDDSIETMPSEWRRPVELFGLGIGNQGRGSRAGVILVDDPDQKSTVGNPEVREKIMDWFQAELIGILGKDDPMIVMGTLLHPECLVAKLLKDPETGMSNPGFKSATTFAAYTEEDDGIRTALWPKVWDLGSLDIRRGAMGSKAFDSEFMNDPWSDTRLIFPREWMRDERWKVLPSVYDDGKPVVYVYFVGVDLASTEEERRNHNQSAVVTGAVATNGDFAGHVYIVEAKQGFWTTMEIVDEILDTCEKYSPMAVSIEKAVGQKFILLPIMLAGERRKPPVYPPLQEMPADMDKVRRAGRVQPFAELRKLHLRDDMHSFYNEVTTFPTHRQMDRVDAMVYLLQQIQLCGYDPAQTVDKPKDLTWSERLFKRAKERSEMEIANA